MPDRPKGKPKPTASRGRASVKRARGLVPKEKQTRPKAPPEDRAIRGLLAGLVFLPLVVGMLPGAGGQVFVRFALAVLAFWVLNLLPEFNEELTVDPEGRWWQALMGVIAGAALGIARGLGARYTDWTGVAVFGDMLGMLEKVRSGPLVGLLELLPLLILAGVLEAIVYAGMLRWILTRPRGPLAPLAAAALTAVIYAWLHFCMPQFPNSISQFGPQVRAAAAYALVGLVNGLLICLATHRTRSPLLAGAFIGTQWWACIAMLYLGRG